MLETKKSNLLFALVILTVFLVLAEISFLVQRSELFLGDFQLVANHLVVPWRKILPDIFFFLLAQFFVYVLFVAAVFLLVQGLRYAACLSIRTTEIVGITLWFFLVIVIFLTNQLHYPNSKFALLTLSEKQHVVLNNFLWFCNIVIGLLVFVACVGFARRFYKNWLIALTCLSSLVVGGFIYFLLPIRTVTDAATIDRPNIILIGMDSLRPDYLGFFGGPPHSPHIDHFLTHSTVFSEALTPIARTYSAWFSVLTGLYPKVSGARTDLQDATQLDKSVTLSAILQKKGYQTLYMTDESRFSNIDERYGFDRIVTPPMGFNDFLLATLNDFPLSNLLANTFVGPYLFPYTYANRAAFVLYDPDSFLQRIRTTLMHPRKAPLFMAIHFCLPHYPYAWASLAIKKVEQQHYQAAVQRMDSQFYGFLKILKENHLLDHSLVIVLSDHGEGIEKIGDRITDPDLYVSASPHASFPRFYPPSAAHERVNMSGGHGTDVLGLPQYHTLLAFRSFGLVPAFNKRIATGIVSLMDIHPTVLAYLRLSSNKTNGFSLLPEILDQHPMHSAHGDLFVESDFSPEAIRSVHPEMRKVFFEGMDYFHIDAETARITVRDSMFKMIVSSKQYADYRDNWVLALYPQANNRRIPVLVNLQTGEWTTNLTIPFAQHSPASHMLAALQTFFGNDISTVKMN